MITATVIVRHGGKAGRDDEELSGDELELRGEREEAGIERGFGLSLLESFAVVEVSMGEDATEPTGKRGEVAVRGRRDGKPIAL